MEPFVGEIRAFGFNYAPRGWALCNGSLMPIQQFTTLFSILGTTYGGDGVQSFALPNLQGSVAIGVGGGNGLSPQALGQVSGTSSVTLNTAQLGSHTHTLNARAAAGQGPDAANATLASGIWVQGNRYGPVQQYSTLPPDTQTSAAATLPAGSGQAHNNMMPYLAFNFCIALDGIYPQRP